MTTKTAMAAALLALAAATAGCGKRPPADTVDEAAKEFDAFVEDTGYRDALVGVIVPDAGRLVEKIAAIADADLTVADMLMPDGSRVVSELGRLGATVSETKDGGYRATLRALAATEKDAESLKNVISLFLMPLAASLKNASDEEGKTGYKIVRSVKVRTSGRELSVSVAIPAGVAEKAARMMR